jgi:hypothetical protein
MSAFVIVSPDKNIILISLGLLFLHMWIYFVHSISTSFIADILGYVILVLIQWLSNLYLIPISCIILISLSYMSANLLNYLTNHITGQPISFIDPIRHIINTIETREGVDLIYICIPVMFIFVPLYYLKQYIGWKD